MFGFLRESKKIRILIFGAHALFSVRRSKSSCGCVECVEKCDCAETRAQSGLEQHDHTPRQYRYRQVNEGSQRRLLRATVPLSNQEIEMAMHFFPSVKVYKTLYGGGHFT